MAVVLLKRGVEDKKAVDQVGKGFLPQVQVFRDNISPKSARSDIAATR